MATSRRNIPLLLALALLVFPVLLGATARLWWLLTLPLESASPVAANAVRSVAGIASAVCIFLLCRKLYRRSQRGTDE